MSFKEKKEPVTKLIFGLGMQFTPEDKKQIAKLIESYFRKRTNFVNSGIENIAGGLLWVYSRINFLFEDNKSWSQQKIAGILGVRPKTISNIASMIMSSLKIDCFDKRFARKEVAEQNPINNFVMTKSGFILHKDQIKELMIEQMLKDASEQGLISKSNIEKTSKEKTEKDAVEDKNKKLKEFFR
jgi:hypothetical protein